MSETIAVPVDLLRRLPAAWPEDADRPEDLTEVSDVINALCGLLPEDDR